MWLSSTRHLHNNNNNNNNNNNSRSSRHSHSMGLVTLQPSNQRLNIISNSTNNSLKQARAVRQSMRRQ